MSDDTTLTTLEGGLDEVNPPLEYPLKPGDRYFYDGTDYSAGLSARYEDPHGEMISFRSAFVGDF